MTDGPNRLRNLLSASAWSFGMGCLVSAILLSLWWGTAHRGASGGSSLGGPLDLLAILGFGFFALGISTVPRKNFRLGTRRGRASLKSDRDDPHRMARWGIVAGLLLALFNLTVVGPPAVHWLRQHHLLVG